MVSKKEFILWTLIYGFLGGWGMAQAGVIVGVNYGTEALDLGSGYKDYTPTGHHFGFRTGVWFPLLGGELGVDKVVLSKNFYAAGEEVELKVNGMRWYAGAMLPFFTPFSYLRGGLSMHKLSGSLNGQSTAIDGVTQNILDRVNESLLGYYFGLGAKYDIGPFLILTEGTVSKAGKQSLFQWNLGGQYLF